MFNLFLFLDTITVRSLKKPVNSCTNLSTQNLNLPGFISAEVRPVAEPGFRPRGHKNFLGAPQWRI
jgi:hypothetical protein